VIDKKEVLSYVFVGDIFVNAELIKLGYAYAITYQTDVKYQEYFLTLQREAEILYAVCGQPLCNKILLHIVISLCLGTNPKKLS